jgi:hypothetical protein
MVVVGGAMNQIAFQVPKARVINVKDMVVVGGAMNQIAFQVPKARLINV